MSIKKYIADKDTTITNSFLINLTDRAHDANMGAADSLEMFSLYGQTSKDSLEKSRILVHFPSEDIRKDRQTSKIPLSGSVKFYLKLYNVTHPFSLPKDYFAQISLLSSSWDEGYGLDMENYTDNGWNSTNLGSGATWKYSLSGTLWTSPGADIIDNQEYNLSFYFKDGTEDIELDITNIVEKWVSNELENNGFLIKMSGSYEDGGLRRSFYTKKFSARGSQFFFKRPAIEARWESISTDDRGNFYASSSLLPEQDNKMNIYFINSARGTLRNIPNNPTLSVKLYSDVNKTNEIPINFLNISNPLSGTYKATLSVDTTASILYDVWYDTLTNQEYFSSSIDVNIRQNNDSLDDKEYIINVYNNKQIYNTSEIAKFKIFIREKDWQPTIYSKSYNTVESTTLNDLYYKIFRLNDNYVVMDYSTGSLEYTKTSYNSDENYFDLDMSILEKNYNYGIKLARWNGNNLVEYPNTFKFKVE